MASLANEDAPTALLILASATLPGSDRDAFNKWYTEVHVPDVLTIEEFVSCRRYKVAGARLNPGHQAQPTHEYVAVYKIRARTEEDLARAVAHLDALRDSGISVSTSFDFTRTTASFLLPITDEIVKDPDYVPSNVAQV
jgi:hypothetical protein